MLFDLDEHSIDVAADALRRQPADTAPAREARAEPTLDQPARQQARAGLFTINKLIHRVAGHGQHEERTAKAERREPGRAELEEDGADIPAFLRRQAN